MLKTIVTFSGLTWMMISLSSMLIPDMSESAIDSITDHSYPSSLKLKKVIQGKIQPKSVSHSGTGRFFAQNMMYRHSITVYDRNYNLIHTISDQVRLADHNILGYTGWHKGSPVECAFSPDGKYAWVSNYKMYGADFENPGTDDCDRSPNFDQSYLYKINTQSLDIEQIIPVGSVPKYVAASPDGKFVLVSNWCSGDVSVIDTELGAEIHRIPLGRYPRGIVIDSKSQYAYICMMGMARLAKVNLSDYSKEWISRIGITPRHACISPDDRYLYLSLNLASKLVKLDLIKNEVVASVETGSQPRSMVLTPDGKYLYVGNYKDHTMSKVDAESFIELEEVETEDKPIGITFDPMTKSVWLACYSGSIMVFEDTDYEQVDIQHDATLPPEEEAIPTFHIIVGNYEEKSRAEEKVHEVKRDGYQAEIIIQNDRFQVSCGREATRRGAEQILRTLPAQFQDAWILKKNL